MSQPPTQLLVVEDDQSLGQTMKERLEKQGHRVTWCQSAEAAESTLQLNSFDLVVLDVGLPGISGFELGQRLKSKHPLTPFLFVTAQSGAEDRLKGYELGAEEFIPKPFHLKEFLLRVQHVLDNHRKPARFEYAELAFDFSSMVFLKNHQPLAQLGVKDLLVLRLLIEESPRVLSRDQVLNQVWGEDQFPSNRTVDNSMSRLRQALGEPYAQFIKSVRGLGYQWMIDSNKGESNGE